MGISQSTLAMESGPERDERMEEVPAPEAERNTEEPTTGLVPSAGTLELQQGGEIEAPTGRRHTEILELPKVDRRAPATPTVRPGGESSTPATAKSRAERKQEKKTARKEEKTARKEEKRNRRAKKAEQAEEQEEKPEGTPPKTPVRRKLDAAMESAGSIESVLLLEREYKALQRDPSHRPNFYFLIDRLISNLRHIPRTVFGPPAGEEERIKLMELRGEEEAEEAEAAHRAAEEVDEGSASRKRKLEELEEKKRALEEQNDRKRKELEEESRRLKAVEEAERRAREQRSRTPEYKYQLPARRRSRRPGSSGKLQNWWRTTSSRTARSRRSRKKPQKLTPQHVRIPNKLMKTSSLRFRKPRRRLKHSRSVWEEPWKPQWLSAAKRSVPSSTLRPKTSVRAQKYHEFKARPQIPAGLQERIRKEKAQQEESSKPGKKEGSEVPTSTKPGPFWGVRARKQPAEEEPGKEWREKISEDVWKVGRQLKEGERYLECKYPPFSQEWQEKLREELLNLAHRGFAKKEDGELYPTRRFGWQLRSIREFESINQSLERDYGVRLVWKSQEVKGKSKSVDDFHCYPIGRGKMEKVTKFGVQYTVLGTLPPNKSMCSICWSEGHWKSGCPFKDMVFELWEPALAVLVPAERLRKYYPCRNIVCEA